MSVDVATTTTEGCTDVCALLLSKAMLMMCLGWARDCMGLCGPSWPRGHVLSLACAAAEVMLVSVACALTGGHVFVLSLETVLRILACADAGLLDDIHGLYSCQKLHGRPWSVLMLTLQGREVPFVVVLMTTEAQLRKRGIEGFQNNPSSFPLPKVTA